MDDGARFTERGCPSSPLANLIHIEKTVATPFDVAKQAKTVDGQTIDVAAHVENDQASGKLKVVFSRLGRPPAYQGATTLFIGPNEHKVLRLPAIHAANGEHGSGSLSSR
jgi:hypothetical protein